MMDCTGGRLDLSQPGQVLDDLPFLVDQLPFIGQHLPFAASADPEMGAERRRPVRGQRTESLDPSFRPILFVLREDEVHYVSRYRSFYKNDLSIYPRQCLTLRCIVRNRHLFQCLKWFFPHRAKILDSRYVSHF